MLYFQESKRKCTNPVMKLLSSVTNHNSNKSFFVHISIWKNHKARAECSTVFAFSFLASDDEMAEKAGESSRTVARLSGGVSLTWQGT